MLVKLEKSTVKAERGLFKKLKRRVITSWKSDFVKETKPQKSKAVTVSLQSLVRKLLKGRICVVQMNSHIQFYFLFSLPFSTLILPIGNHSQVFNVYSLCVFL